MNLVLDLDGTLITCEPRQLAVLQAALSPLGVRVDLTKVWELKRNGASTEQALVQLGETPALARQVSEAWRSVVEEPVWLGLDTVPGDIGEVLSNMRVAGARLWLLTSRSRSEWVPQQLARLGLSIYLHQVLVVKTRDAVLSKSEMLRNISPAAFFGDTESDWNASMSADIPFFAVATGQRSAAFLNGIGVGVVYCNLAAAWDAFLAESACKPRA